MRHTTNGVTTLHDDVVIPGYVFFEAPSDAALHELIPGDDMISVLTYSDGDWRLFGEDENYAKFIFRYDGTLTLSTAHKIGDRIVIIDCCDNLGRGAFNSKLHGIREHNGVSIL